MTTPTRKNRPRNARKARTVAETGRAAESVSEARWCGLVLGGLELLGLLDLVMGADGSRAGASDEWGIG
jgi:hypothetical protein